MRNHQFLLSMQKGGMRLICIHVTAQNMFILKVCSYYTAIVLRYQHINYISAAGHRSITAFQIEMNLTFMPHRNAVTSHECECSKATQCNCGVVWTDLKSKYQNLHNFQLFFSICSKNCTNKLQNFPTD